MTEFRTGSKDLAYEILRGHPNADGDANALNALGVMETFLEDYDAASESLGRALELLDQRKAIALANLATVRIYQRNWTEAESLSVQATKAGPVIPHGWINLLFILARTEQYEKLEANFDKMDVDFVEWRTCDELVTRIREDTLPALRKSPSIRDRIELKLSS
jgi:tetratricopeptide (TPR) repeat protein